MLLVFAVADTITNEHYFDVDFFYIPARHVSFGPTLWKIMLENMQRARNQNNLGGSFGVLTIERTTVGPVFMTKYIKKLQIAVDLFDAHTRIWQGDVLKDICSCPTPCRHTDISDSVLNVEHAFGYNFA